MEYTAQSYSGPSQEQRDRAAVALASAAIAAVLCLLCLKITGDTFSKNFPIPLFLHGLTVAGILSFVFLKKLRSQLDRPANNNWKTTIVLGVWNGYRVLIYTWMITPFIELPVLLLAPVAVTVGILIMGRKKELLKALLAVAYFTSFFTIPWGFIIFPYAIFVAPLSGIFCLWYFKAVQKHPALVWIAAIAAGCIIYFTPWHQYLVLMLMGKNRSFPWS